MQLIETTHFIVFTELSTDTLTSYFGNNGLFSLNLPLPSYHNIIRHQSELTACDTVTVPGSTVYCVSFSHLNQFNQQRINSNTDTSLNTSVDFIVNRSQIHVKLNSIQTPNQTSHKEL